MTEPDPNDPRIQAFLNSVDFLVDEHGDVSNWPMTAASMVLGLKAETLASVCEDAHIAEPDQLTALPFLATAFLVLMKMNAAMTRQHGKTTSHSVSPFLALAAFDAAARTMFGESNPATDAYLDVARVAGQAELLLVLGAALSTDWMNRPKPDQDEYTRIDRDQSDLHKAARALGTAASLAAYQLSNGYAALDAGDPPQLDPAVLTPAAAQAVDGAALLSAFTMPTGAVITPEGDQT